MIGTRRRWADRGVRRQESVAGEHVQKERMHQRSGETEVHGHPNSDIEMRQLIDKIFTK